MGSGGFVAPNFNDFVVTCCSIAVAHCGFVVMMHLWLMQICMHESHSVWFVIVTVVNLCLLCNFFNSTLSLQLVIVLSV